MSLTKVSYSMIEGAVTNVLDFGATGDGVTDDRAAIQAAIDYVAAQGGGTVYFPKPVDYYRITSKHPVEDCGLLIQNNNITLKGHWVANTHEAAHIRCFFSSSTLAGLYVKGTCRGLVFDGITVFTDFATNVGYMEVVPTLTMRQCRFTCNNTTANIAAGRAADNALRIDQTFVSTLENVWTTGIVGFRIGTVSGECTSTTFTSCYSNRPRDVGFLLTNVVYSTLNSCACDGAGGAWNTDLLTAYQFVTCSGITMNACGAEEGRTALRMITACTQMTINGLWIAGYGAKTIGDAAPLIEWDGSGSIQSVRYSLSGTRFYPARPFVFTSFNLPGQRISVLDAIIPRSLIGNALGAGTTTNRNLFVMADSPQLRTFQFAAAAGTVLTIPIVSQNSAWIKHSLQIRGCTQDGAASNPRPFESTIAFRSLTSLADITSNNAYGITSVTDSGMNLVVTLANAVDGIIVTIDPLYRDRRNGFAIEAIDFDNITFS
jgi:hypothetical protein